MVSLPDRQRDNDHIRITAQLIDAATGETLWSDRYDRLIGEIFAIQSDVADHIANSLGGREGKVGKSMAAGAKRKPPADLGAYELYLLAQETMYSDLSAEHMREAQKILEQAIAKDPDFARAYVRYANTFAWLATYEANAGELFQGMLTYARKAVALLGKSAHLAELMCEAGLRAHHFRGGAATHGQLAPRPGPSGRPRSAVERGGPAGQAQAAPRLKRSQAVSPHLGCEARQPQASLRVGG